MLVRAVHGSESVPLSGMRLRCATAVFSNRIIVLRADVGYVLSLASANAYTV